MSRRILVWIGGANRVVRDGGEGESVWLVSWRRSRERDVVSLKEHGTTEKRYRSSWRMAFASAREGSIDVCVVSSGPVEVKQLY